MPAGDGTPLLAIFVVACAALTLVGAYAPIPWLVYVFKPLTTALIAVAAFRVGGEPFYRGAIFAGLAFSLVGDVLLMLPADRFVAGLAAFFAAHVCYVAAFLSGGRPNLPLTVLLALLAFAAVLLRVLAAGAGRLLPLASLYAGAPAAMAWVAVGRWMHLGTPGAATAAVGACLFVLSDSALAVDRFGRRFHGAQALVLSTYYAAQWLIATSA
ncbi:MAG: YhhN-like protein [Gemmatimonadetes bacterium]|nr:YhhN-like protein [Gemmatimonadota bacterium]